ncbi:MAG: zinc ribbon-containing protein [Gammaproteobacteria bacterium]|nr:zinc ribbon-containing protein [Gammaproteobacteria bacterium]
MNTHNESTTEKLVHAYNRMMNRAKKATGKTEKGDAPSLQHAIEAAKQEAIQLGEVSREEAEKIATYLRRDVEDAASFMNRTEQAFTDWLHFELDLIEVELFDLFSGMVDHTRIELDRLADQARHADEWYTGEVTGIGTLHCTHCGQALHFYATGHIPPCPKCHKTTFKRDKKA